MRTQVYHCLKENGAKEKCSIYFPYMTNQKTKGLTNDGHWGGEGGDGHGKVKKVHEGEDEAHTSQEEATRFPQWQDEL